MIPRRRMHRATFVLAGMYNIAWGLYAIADPQWLFRVTGMAPMRHPEIFMTLGLVIGLYGILYLEVAREPNGGWPIAAVGLAGKVLGPLGFTVAVATGELKSSAVILIITNDLIWWLPFGLYLYDAWPAFRQEFALGC